MFSRVLSSVALKRAALVGGAAVGLAVSGPSLYAYAPYQDVHTSEKFAEFRQSQEALKTGDATGYNVKVADGDLFLVQSSTMAMNARTPTEEIPEGYQSKFEIFLRSAPSTSPDHLEAESADEEVTEALKQCEEAFVRYADCREEQAFYHKFWQVKEDEDDDEDDE